RETLRDRIGEVAEEERRDQRLVAERAADERLLEVELRIRHHHRQLGPREPEEGRAAGAEGVAVRQRLEDAIEPGRPLELDDELPEVVEPRAAPLLVERQEAALRAVVGEHVRGNLVRDALEERVA